MKRREDQKSVTVGTLSADALWAGLIANIPPARPAGEGWLTITELAAKLNVSHNGAHNWARTQEARGLVEFAQGRHPTSNRPTLYVRPKAAA